MKQKVAIIYKFSFGLIEKILVQFGLSRTASNQMISFGIVGVLVAFVYFAISLFLSSVLAWEPWKASTAGYFLAIITQYFLQTLFTFKRPLNQPRQAVRFFFTVLTGLVFSTILTGYFWPKTGLEEFLGYLVVIFTLPITNFIIFKFWVYRKNFDES